MSGRDNSSTFAKGLAVLECFESGRTDLTMADVARITGFDRAAARRLCLTLEETGYLTRQGKTLRLTPKIVALTGGYLASKNIGQIVQPVLNQFAEELKGEIALTVREGTRALYIARSAVSTARHSLGFSVGSTLPLLPTAVGRILLASCTADLRETLISRSQLTRLTSVTDMDRNSISQKIEIASAQGYAYSVSEFEMGAAGLAVPIPDMDNAQAALATTASINQFEQEGELDRVLDILRRAAMLLRA